MFLCLLVLLVSYLRMLCLTQDHEHLLLYFFLKKKLTLLRKTFLVLTLTFRSLIHFKLIFVNGVRNRFILKSARFSPTLFPHSVHTFSLLNADPEPPFLAFFFSPATLKIFSKYFSSIKPLDGFVLQHTFPPHREP